MVELNPFRSWVPKAVGVVYSLLMLVICMSVDCVYSSLLNENVGIRGMQSDDVQWALFCLVTGMCAGAPFVSRLLRICRLRAINVIGLTLMIAIEYLARDVETPLVYALLSLTMGFVRMPCMMVNMMAMLTYLTGKNMATIFEDAPERTEEQWQKTMRIIILGMAFMYLVLMSMQQVGTSFSAWVAYVLYTRSVYDLMILFMATMLVLTIALMERPRMDNLPEVPEGDTRWPFTAGRMMSAVFFMVCGCTFAWATTHGYNQDWFNSAAVRLNYAASLVFLGAFLLTDCLRPKDKRYWDYEILALPSARWALLIFFLAIILNSSSLLVTICSQLTMHLDQWHSACLSMWAWVGYVLATLLVALTFKFIHYRHYWTVAISFFTAYALSLYLTVQTEMEYSHLIWLTIVRAMGLFLIYSTCMALSFYRRPGSLLASWILIMLFTRNLIGNGIGIAFYQQHMLEGQLEYLQSYAPAYNGLMAAQGMIGSVKQLAGITFWLGLAVVIFLLACNWDWLKGKKATVSASEYAENKH